MKKTSISLIFALCLCLPLTSYAAGEDLFGGEYTLRAYTLKNGDANVTYSDGAGTTFHELYIFSNAMDTVLNRDDDYSASLAARANSSFQGVSIKADYSPTEAITLHSSLGLTDTSSDERIDYSERLGWELDLGLAYRFLNKFAYEIHFGYMDTGLLFEDTSRYTDIEEITIVTSKLTMSF